MFPAVAVFYPEYFEIVCILGKGHILSVNGTHRITRTKQKHTHETKLRFERASNNLDKSSWGINTGCGGRGAGGLTEITITFKTQNKTKTMTVSVSGAVNSGAGQCEYKFSQFSSINRNNA